MRWTNKEQDILRQYYSSAKKEDILKMLPNRTWCAIQAQCEERLNLGRPLTAASHHQIAINLSETEKAYLAGIIDGEGTLIATWQTKTKVFAFEITVANTNKAVLEWIVKKVGVGGVYAEKRSPNSQYYKTRKYAYKYRLYRISQILPLITAIRPYMIIKRKQADLLEEIINAIVKEKQEHNKRNGYVYSQQIHEIYKKLKEVNHKGNGQLNLGDF